MTTQNLGSAFVTFGSAQVTVGKDTVTCALNAVPQQLVRTFFFNGFVSTGYLPYSSYLCAGFGFNRFSGMRYYKERSILHWYSVSGYLYGAGLYRSYNYAYSSQDYRDNETQRLFCYAMKDLATSDDCMNVASVGAILTGWYSGSGLQYPDKAYGTPFFSCVDIPGTTLGNVHKHPLGRSAWFNEVGQVALSQGDVILGGDYRPNENVAYTKGIQIYVTKSGGTGQPILATYTDTGSIANANEFSDSGYTFTAADLYKQVKITDSISGNNATYVIGELGPGGGGFGGAYLATHVVSIEDLGSNVAKATVQGTVWTADNPIPYVVGDVVYIVGSASWNGSYTITEVGVDFFKFACTSGNPTEIGFCTKKLTSESGLTWQMREASLPYMQTATNVGDEITDPYYQFTASDVNRYIKVFNGWSDGGGIFKIKSVSSGKATVDASDHSESIPDDSDGLSWEVRTGPIGEYFWRERRYNRSTTWVYWPDFSHGFDVALGAMMERINVLNVTTLPKRPCMRSVHDRAACRWAIFDLGQENVSYAPYGLIRLKELCHEGYDFPYLDNDITNMPTGIRYWRDILNWGSYLGITIDDQSTSVGYSYFLIDPIPGGEARYPDCLHKVGRQANFASTGLPTKNARGLAKSASYLWVLCGSDGTRNGGIAYSANGGYDWNLIHEKMALTGTNSWNVAADGRTVSNPANDAALLSELIINEWITFDNGLGGESKAQVEVILSNNSLYLTDATKFGGALTGKTMMKGALNTAHCAPYFANVAATGGNVQGYVPTPADGDSADRLYWIPMARTGVCRFDPNTTDKVTEVTSAQLAGGYTFTNPTFLTVTKMPNIAGSGASVFHDNIWVGASNASNQYFTRIYNWTTPSITRYHKSISTDNWPTQMKCAATPDCYGCKVIQDPVSGAIYVAHYYTSSYGTPGIGRIITDVKPSDTTYFGVYQWLSYLNPNRFDDYNAGWGGCAVVSAEFDDLGLGTHFMPGFLNTCTDNEARAAFLINDHWTCYRWGGAMWQAARLNETWSYIDFQGAIGGPRAENTPTEWLGSGTRRMHDWNCTLQGSTMLRFQQQGGATAQADEYVIDENFTFIASIGRVKDNTMTAHFEMDYHLRPTVARLDEPAQDIGSLWTTIGGWDGGFVNNASDQAWPVPMRGFAEATHATATAITNYPSTTYITPSTQVINNPSDPHYAITLRIHDVYAKAAGGTTGLDIFNSGGVGKATANEGAIFTTADVGKTVRVEGASTGGNNTSKVITGLDGASPNATVILDSVWAADENDLAWRLRDVPSTGYVVADFWNLWAYSYYTQNWKLYSSRDGKTWDLVKETKYFNGVAANDPVEKSGATGYIDPGVYFDWLGINPLNPSVAADQSGSRAIIFDLRSLPEHQRRRCYWKLHRENAGASGGNLAYISTMALFTDLFVPLAPSSLMGSDRSDPNYVAMRGEPRAILFESVGDAIGVEEMDSVQAFTSTIQVANVWEQSGTDGETTGSSSTFTAGTATFPYDCIGKKIRAPLAQVTGGAYNGWLTITGWNSETSVTVDRTFSGSQTDLPWALVAFGPGDYIRFNDTTTFFRHIGKPLIVQTFVVADAPASNRIKATTQEIPYSVSCPVWVERPFDHVWMFYSRYYEGGTWYWYHWWDQATTWDTGFNAGWDQFYGIFAVADSAQFITVDSDAASRTASSGADTDGDGWNDVVTITSKEIHAQAAVDDWILLYNGSVNGNFRRWHQIKSINRTGGQTILTLYEDEVPLSETFYWKVCKRRPIKFRLVRTNTTLKETA